MGAGRYSGLRLSCGFPPPLAAILGGERFEPVRGVRTLSCDLAERRRTKMKNIRIALGAAGLAAASLGLAPLLATSAEVNLADCPQAWYWDNYRQNCLPPGLPKDPPNGCLTGNGTHLNGTICIN
jgi:hypothetical protein